MLEIFMQQLVNGLVAGLLYAILAVGLTMTFGILNIVNFAHGEFLMVGAYGTYAATVNGIPFPVALLIGAVAAGILGIVVEKVLFRNTLKEPINGLVVSLGLILIMSNLMAKIAGTQPYNMTVPTPGVMEWNGVFLSNQRLYTVVACILVVVCIWYLLQRTGLGRSMRALASDPTAIALMGARTDWLYAIAFGVGCALAAISGGLMAGLYALSPFMGNFAVAKGFIVIVIGGLGSIPGAIIGGLLLGVVEAMGAGYISSAFRDGFGFAILILILLLKPNGLYGIIERRA